MKCKCGFETQEKVALKHGCLMCGDKSYVDLTKLRVINNKINRNAKEYEYRGEFKTLSEWCEETGVNYATANGRRWRGLSIEEILQK